MVVAAVGVVVVVVVVGVAVVVVVVGVGVGVGVVEVAAALRSQGLQGTQYQKHFNVGTCLRNLGPLLGFLIWILLFWGHCQEQVVDASFCLLQVLNVDMPGVFMIACALYGMP